MQNGPQPSPKSRASPQKDSGACAGEPTPAKIWKHSHEGSEEHDQTPSQQLLGHLGINGMRMRTENKTLYPVKAITINKTSVSIQATCWGIYGQLKGALSVNKH